MQWNYWVAEKLEALLLADVRLEIPIPKSFDTSASPPCPITGLEAAWLEAARARFIYDRIRPHIGPESLSLSPRALAAARILQGSILLWRANLWYRAEGEAAASVDRIADCDRADATFQENLHVFALAYRPFLSDEERTIFDQIVSGLFTPTQAVPSPPQAATPADQWKAASAEEKRKLAAAALREHGTQEKAAAVLGITRQRLAAVLSNTDATVAATVASAFPASPWKPHKR